MIPYLQELSLAPDFPVFSKYQKSYVQQHPFPADEVFRLLCPEEETKWLQNWEYKMIYSESGGLETDAIFTTPHHGEQETIWYTVRHYPKERYVEFVRVTPEVAVAHIELRVAQLAPQKSQTLVSYTFTPLSTVGDSILKENILPSFNSNMKQWETSINYYLEHGGMLIQG